MQDKKCDVAKLKGKMIEKGFLQDTFAKAIGMDRSTLNRKLKTGESFTIGEANKIASALSLNDREALDIFFPSIVA